MTPQEFKEARKKLNWTQKQIADEFKISKRTITNYETGAQAIPVITSKLLELIIKMKGL